MTILENFRLIAEEFDAIDDDKVLAIIEYVSPEVSESKFGKMYARAMAHLVAHWFSWKKLIAESGGGSGLITGGRLLSEKEGDLTRTYSDKDIATESGTFIDNLGKTSYGLEFKRIRRMTITPILTRMG